MADTSDIDDLATGLTPAVLAGRGYDSDAFRRPCRERGTGR